MVLNATLKGIANNQVTRPEVLSIFRPRNCMDQKEDLLGGRVLDDLEQSLGDRPGGELWSSCSGGVMKV